MHFQHLEPLINYVRYNTTKKSFFEHIRIYKTCFEVTFDLTNVITDYEDLGRKDKI